MNGKPAKAFSISGLRRLLRREGERVRLEAKRGNETIDVEFQLREHHRFFATPTGPVAKVLAELRLREDCEAPIASVDCLGETRHFLLSTITSVTVLDDSLRTKLGDSIRRQTVASDHGMIPREIFKSPPVEFRGLQLRGRAGVCIDLSSISDYVGFQLAGLIGLDSLYNQIVELDLSGHTLRIYDRVPDGTKRDSVVLPLHGDGTGMTVRANLPIIGPQEFLLEFRISW